MDIRTTRPSSVTFLLVGLVLLVTVGGLIAALVPCVDCPLQRHKLMWGVSNPTWECPLCDGGYFREGKRIPFMRKLTWRPQTQQEWWECPPDERPKLPEEKK